MLIRYPTHSKGQNIYSETAINANFQFSHYKSMAAANRVLIRLQQNNTYSFPRPTDAIPEIWKESASRLQRRYPLKKLTDGQSTDAYLYYKLTNKPSAQVS